MIKRGRVYRKGENSGNHKLKKKDILDIRSSGSRTIDLAKKYGVNRVTINAIKRKQTWRHI